MKSYPEDDPDMAGELGTELDGEDEPDDPSEWECEWASDDVGMQWGPIAPTNRWCWCCTTCIPCACWCACWWWSWCWRSACCCCMWCGQSAGDATPWCWCWASPTTDCGSCEDIDRRSGTSEFLLRWNEDVVDEVPVTLSYGMRPFQPGPFFAPTWPAHTQPYSSFGRFFFCTSQAQSQGRVF